jgi:uncharacterized protein (TIGR04255 family)
MDFDNLRLEPDSIVEALFEMRFRSSDVPEIVTGKLSANLPITDAVFERLPLADFPAPVRRSDPNLAIQPLLQARTNDSSRFAKIGEQVFSWHALNKYPGWEQFKPELDQALTHVFAAVGGLDVDRLGFRYVNLLTQAHHIEGFGSFNMDASVGGQRLTSAANLNFQKTVGEQTILVRIATPEFVQGPGTDFLAMIDVDVFQAAPSVPQSKEVITAWLETAHTNLKREFFSLLTPEIIKRLGKPKNG